MQIIHIVIFMKKVIILFLSIALIGCASTSSSTKLDNITALSAVKKCTPPDEIHSVQPFRFPIPAQVIRHANCLGINDMLMVMYPGEASEKNQTAAKLLMLMYVEFSNDKLQDTTLSGKFLKTDTLLQEDGSIVRVAFFELIITKKNNKSN